MKASTELHAASEQLLYTTMKSPVGSLLLAADERGLRFLSFVRDDRPARIESSWRESDDAFMETKRQLDAYFRRELRAFTIPLHLVGTEFQRSVWNALLQIPYGSTTSYGELAFKIGRPSAVRAVGGANHANPIAIIVPCHRVIGSTGKLVGYGGGLYVKDRLLALERGELFSF